MSGRKSGAAERFWAVGGLSALMLGGFAAPVLAQEAGGEEIIVVAQRRAENIQDVPLSVSVFSAERLAAANASGADILALASTVPGLNVESSNGRAAPRFYIRGLGNTDFDLAASQPVAIMMDDVILENVTLRSFPLFDVRQIEVSRGPQGTLFGRNTIAGVVNIITNRPTDTFEALGSVSYGTYGSSNIEGAISGPLLGDALTARASINYRRRDDWIDNGFSGPGVASEIGGFEDLAGRLQFQFQPTENFTALLNLHGRTLDGNSASVFRANVFTLGSNDLNSNFDRDRVSFNQGGGNPQEYDNWGTSLTATYDFAGATLTSITAYETIEGRSRGDIDGGVSGVGPGFIPFDADTQDSIDDLEQISQEVRLASTGEGPFGWQIGAFYFDSEFQITTVGPSGFPPAATVVHENTSWAVFGQASFDLSESLTLTGGVRYTDDDKDFRAPVAPFGPFAPVSVSDSQVSGDLSLTYEVSPELTWYGRIATGFRAPSIQGRDVAFGGPPSIAQSETALSFEAGFHAIVLENTGRVNASIFHYTIEDMQLSAIGGASNSNRLINADEGVAYGFEIDGEFDVNENFSFNVGLNYTNTEINDPNLLVAPGGSGPTVLDPLVVVGPDTFANIDGNPFPQAPDFTLNFGARYGIPTANGGEWFVDTDWTVRGEMNLFLYESVEFRTDTQFEGGLRLGYTRQDGAWEVALFARNITDEENVIGAIDFNNLTGFVNEPRIVGISLSARVQ